MSDILVIGPNDDDEYAQEAELDGLEGVEESPSKNWLMGIVAGVIVSLVLIGETVGGLIGLNNFENIEFGQGVTVAAACDPELVITPNADPISTNDSAEFNLTSIDIGGISDACLGKTFTLSMYKSVGLGAGQTANIGTRKGGTPTHQVKFALIAQNSDFNGLDWRIYPSEAGLPDPTSASGLSTCGGDNNAIDNVNFTSFNWNEVSFPPGCPINLSTNTLDNALTHLTGFIQFPGTDDGSRSNMNFSLTSTGNAELKVGGQIVISDRETHSASSRSGAFSYRKGTSYSFDLWYFKSNGAGELKLTWDGPTADGVIPTTYFSSQNTVLATISSGELPVNYQVNMKELLSNNRSVRITLATGISTLNVDRFTIETSDT